MAIKKSVLEVEVKDENFKKYLELYNKYQEKVDKLPGAWGKVTKENRASVEAVKMMTASLMANIDIMRKAGDVQSKAADQTSRMARSWQDISRSARNTASSLYGSVTGLLRWTGIGGALAGLVGAGSVFGLDRLAASGGAGRRSSMGLGLSYGQQTGFGLAYNRLIDSGAFLGGVSTARGDISSGAAGTLFSLGLNPLGAGSTGSLSNEALKRVRDLVRNSPEEHMGVLSNAYGLGNLGLGTEDLRRLRSMSDEEFTKYQGDYERRTKQTDVSDATLRRWQDLDVQLDAVTQKLKTSLLVALEALAKPLEQVSEELSNFIQALAGSNGAKYVIESIAKGLQWFADYVKSESFKTDVQNLFNKLEQFAKAIGNMAEFISRWFGDTPKQADGTPVPPKTLQELRPDWFKDKKVLADPSSGAVQPLSHAEKRNNQIESIKQSWRETWNFIKPDFSRNPYSPSTAPTGNMDAWKRSIASIESGGAKDPYTILGPATSSGDRAHGKYQVMGANIPSWTKQALGYSMTPAEFLANPSAQEKVFEKIFGDYVKRYGNPQDAAAAWFAGPGGVGTNRKDVLGTSVPAYVDKFNRGMGGGNRVDININNNTGGSAVVTTSQLSLP